MPLLEFQQPQQYVEDNIFYDFHKSFKVWHFAWNDHGWGQDLKKKTKYKHQLVVGKKLTLGHVTGEWRRP